MSRPRACRVASRGNGGDGKLVTARGETAGRKETTISHAATPEEGPPEMTDSAITEPEQFDLRSRDTVSDKTFALSDRERDFRGHRMCSPT